MPWKFSMKISFRSAQLDPVGRKVFQPCSRRISQEQWKVADNKIIIISSTSLVSKPIILEPQSEVRFPRVFRDVGRWSVPWWEGGVEDVSSKGLRPRQAGARALVLAAVVASATTRVIAMVSSFSWVTVGTSVGVEGAACVTVTAETLMYLGHSVLPAALWCLVDQCVPTGTPRGRRRTLKQRVNFMVGPMILGRCGL